MADREEKKLKACLLQSGLHYPQKDIIVCGLCPNRSTDIGDMSKKCVVVPK